MVRQAMSLCEDLCDMKYTKIKVRSLNRETGSFFQLNHDSMTPTKEEHPYAQRFGLVFAAFVVSSRSQVHAVHICSINVTDAWRALCFGTLQDWTVQNLFLSLFHIPFHEKVI